MGSGEQRQGWKGEVQMRPFGGCRPPSVLHMLGGIDVLYMLYCCRKRKLDKQTLSTQTMPRMHAAVCEFEDRRRLLEHSMPWRRLQLHAPRGRRCKLRSTSYGEHLCSILRVQEDVAQIPMGTAVSP